MDYVALGMINMGRRINTPEEPALKGLTDKWPSWCSNLLAECVAVDFSGCWQFSHNIYDICAVQTQEGTSAVPGPLNVSTHGRDPD